MKILIAVLDGKTVVSADHGEMLWDRSFPIPITEILHPNRIYVSELVRVPWLIIDDEWRDIISEDPDGQVDEEDQDESNRSVSDHLETLGYRQ